MNPPLPREPRIKGDAVPTDAFSSSSNPPEEDLAPLVPGEAKMLDGAETSQARQKRAKLLENPSLKLKLTPGTFTYLPPEYRKQRLGLDTYYEQLDKILDSAPETTEAEIAKIIKNELASHFQQQTRELEKMKKKVEKEEKRENSLRDQIASGRLTRSKFVGKEIGIKRSDVKKTIEETLEKLEPAAGGDPGDSELLNAAKERISVLLDLNNSKKWTDPDHEAINETIETALAKQEAENRRPDTALGGALATALQGAGGKNLVTVDTLTEISKPKQETEMKAEERASSEDPFSDENVERVMKTIKIRSNVGQMVSLIPPGEEKAVLYEVGDWDPKAKQQILKKIPGGDEITMSPTALRMHLARKEIAEQLQQEERTLLKQTSPAEDKQAWDKKEVEVAKDLQEIRKKNILRSPHLNEYGYDKRTAHIPSPETVRNLPRLPRKIEPGQIVTLQDAATFETAKWKVENIKQGRAYLINTEKPEEKREVAIGKLAEIFKTNLYYKQAFEREKGDEASQIKEDLPSKKDPLNPERNERWPKNPVGQLIHSFNEIDGQNKAGKMGYLEYDKALYNAFLNWEEKWVRSGDLDIYREKNGNIKMSNEQIQTTIETLNTLGDLLYLESEGHSPGSNAGNIKQQIIDQVRILAGVDDKRNQITYTLPSNTGYLDRLKEVVREVEERAGVTIEKGVTLNAENEADNEPEPTTEESPDQIQNHNYQDKIEGEDPQTQPTPEAVRQADEMLTIQTKGKTTLKGLLAALALGLALGGGFYTYNKYSNKKDSSGTEKEVPTPIVPAQNLEAQKSWAKQVNIFVRPGFELYGKDFAKDITQLNDEELYKKYAPSWYNKDKKSLLDWIYNLNGKIFTNDNSETYEHMPERARKEISDFWAVLQNVSMTTSGTQLQAKTYGEAIKEIKQKVTARENRSSAA